MLHRVPSLGSAVLDRLCNGPEAFSPDCKWIVGEAPEVTIYLLSNTCPRPNTIITYAVFLLF